ncbi:hypothetical protein I3760_07G069300 [Carya illinoinensis]|nr:hypothetical protein I3760_07G069300 [Carya illinoinensis]
MENEEAVELLLKADRSAAYKKDKEGMSALHISAERGHFNVTRKLISELPSTCELLDNKGRTPLHLAVKNGKNIQAVKFMLRSLPIDLINKRDSSGNTPMHLASINVGPQMAWVLSRDKRVLDKGAINKEGLTPIDNILNIKLKWLGKVAIIPKLEAKGFLPSLRSVVAGRTMEVQTIRTGEPRTQSNEIEQQEGNGFSTDGEARLESNLSHAKDIASIGLVVATIVATVTFAAIFTVPYPTDGTSTQQQANFTVPPPNNGTTPSQKQALDTFVISNSLAFVFSVASMFLHYAAFGLKMDPDVFVRWRGISVTLNELAIYAMVIAYGSSLYAVVAREDPILATLTNLIGAQLFFVATRIGALFLCGRLFPRIFIGAVWW